MGEIVAYELSNDKKGLLAFLNTGNSYHVHSNEMNCLQEWIHGLLLKVEEDRLCCCDGWPLESDYCKYCGGKKSDA